MNQRGQESYSGSFVFCVDRWCVSSDAAITDSGLTCSGGNFLLQRMQLKNLPIGRYTGAVCTADGKIVCGSVDFTASGSPEVIASENGIVIYLQKVTSDLVQFVLNSGDQKTWVWAALYAGEYTAETLPEYQPKGYENELLVCRQYDIYTDEYIGLFKFSPPWNLLDNSDFRNPVNQRGQASYTAHGYGIDRWVSSHDFPVSVNTNNITVTGYATYTHFMQAIEKYSFLVGKALTLAIRCKGVSGGTAGLAMIDSADTIHGNTQHTLTGGWQTIVETVTIPGEISTTSLWFAVYTASALDVEWAALYEGAYTAETLPEYQPKGYGAELAECQRYYYTIKSDDANYAAYATGTMNTASTAYFPILFPIPMRTIPTFFYSGSFRVYVNGAGRPFTSIGANMTSRYTVRMSVGGISSGVLGQACELQSSNDGTAFIAFSADL